MNERRIALFVCTNVVGGHEYQAAELTKSLANDLNISVHLNSMKHAKLFEGFKITVHDGALLRNGSLLWQILYGLKLRAKLKNLSENYDCVIISAGAIEASIATGIAFYGRVPTALYVPFFYDRVPEWGGVGALYNLILSRFMMLFDHVITINRVQEFIIKRHVALPTSVIPNKIRSVRVVNHPLSPRLVFIGRLAKQKRIEELLYWLDSRDNPIVEMLIVGDGEEHEHLAKVAHRLKYLKCEFLGWLNDESQDQLLGPGDILLLNSLLEGEPLVVREARLRRMYVLVRDISGVRGITRHNERFTSQDELIKKITALHEINSLPEIRDLGALREHMRNAKIASLIRILRGIVHGGF